jgi:hypothetical protein
MELSISDYFYIYNQLTVNSIPSNLTISYIGKSRYNAKICVPTINFFNVEVTIYYQTLAPTSISMRDLH